MRINYVLNNYSLSIGIFIIALFLLLSFISFLDLKLLTSWDPNELMFQYSNLPPSPSHIFGTDQDGRDVFSRVLAALPTDISIPFIVAGLSVIIGSAVGIVAGYFGGIVDETLMRITDLFLAFPSILLALAIASILGQANLNDRLYYSEIALVVVGWPVYSRLVRGQVLQLKGMPFMILARASGLGSISIIRRHVIPNVLPLILVYVTLDMGTVILIYSILSFFGLGVLPPSPDLGRMVYDGLSSLPENWWSSVFPAIIITLMALGFSLTGEGLRDLMDRRLGYR
jgi:peptide/nickel transport system permease protein